MKNLQIWLGVSLFTLSVTGVTIIVYKSTLKFLETSHKYGFSFSPYNY